MKTRPIPVVVILVNVLLSIAYAKDWPQFRGPGGEGHAAVTGLPTRWSESNNVVWKKALPGSGWSSPVLVDGRLYVTTAVPLDKNAAEAMAARELRLLCLDSKNGELIWDQVV